MEGQLPRLQQLPDDLLSLIGTNLEASDFFYFVRCLDLPRSKARIEYHGEYEHELLTGLSNCAKEQVVWRYFEFSTAPPNWLNLDTIRRMIVNCQGEHDAQLQIIALGDRLPCVVFLHIKFDCWRPAPTCPLWQLRLPRLRALRIDIAAGRASEIASFVSAHPLLETLCLDGASEIDVAELLASESIRRLKDLNVQNTVWGREGALTKWVSCQDKSGPTVCRVYCNWKDSQQVRPQCYHFLHGLRTVGEYPLTIGGSFCADVSAFASCPRNLLPIGDICLVALEAYEFLVAGNFFGSGQSTREAFIQLFPERQLLIFVSNPHFADLPLLLRHCEGRQVAVVTVHPGGRAEILSTGVNPPDDLASLATALAEWESLQAKSELGGTAVAVLDPFRAVGQPTGRPPVRSLLDLPSLHPVVRRHRRWLMSDSHLSINTEAARRDPTGLHEDVKFVLETLNRLPPQ